MIITFLRTIGSILLSHITAYLLWLLFYYLTPYIMGVGWMLFIVYILIAGGLMTTMIGSVASFIAYPLILVCFFFFIAFFASLRFILFFGCWSSLKLPYSINGDFSVLQWILAISLNILVLITFISIIVALFNVNED